jgi:hypothetical protein
MEDKLSDETSGATPPALPADPMKSLTAEEFAALGGEHVVFVRDISGQGLAAFVPQATFVPEDGKFMLVMSADGSPLLVTDTRDAVNEWIDNHSVEVVTRH